MMKTKPSPFGGGNIISVHEYKRYIFSETYYVLENECEINNIEGNSNVKFEKNILHIKKIK